MKEQNKMYKISEVCKITGLTRRALQVYDEKGLIHPYDKTGYWKYCEQDIDKLNAIIVFKECGYKLDEIKRMFESEYLDLDFNELIEKLENKKEQINRSISLIKILEISCFIPESIKIFNNTNYNTLSENDNSYFQWRDNMLKFCDLSDLNKEQLSELSELVESRLSIQQQIIDGKNYSMIKKTNYDILLKYYPIHKKCSDVKDETIVTSRLFNLWLITICQLKNCNIDSCEIRNAIYFYFEMIIEDLEKQTNQNFNKSEIKEFLKKFTENADITLIIEEEEEAENLKKCFGIDATDMIIKAIKYHCKGYIEEVLMKGE